MHGIFTETEEGIHVMWKGAASQVEVIEGSGVSVVQIDDGVANEHAQTDAVASVIGYQFHRESFS